jgi:hypothetical protein
LVPHVNILIFQFIPAGQKRVINTFEWNYSVLPTGPLLVSGESSPLKS